MENDAEQQWGMTPQSAVEREQKEIKRQQEKFADTLWGTRVLTRSLDKDAAAGGYEQSVAYRNQKAAIDGVMSIAEGAFYPHPLVELLPANSLMLSYSRRNAIEAMNINLSLKKVGIDVYFDADETGVVLPKDRKRQKKDTLGVRGIDFEEDFPNEEGNTGDFSKRGIGLGLDWETSIDAGIEESRYGLALLTEDALDKFDIIGGQEIQKMEKDGKKAVMVFFEGEKEKVLQRLRSPEFSQYQDVVDYIEGATTIEVSRDSLQHPDRSTGVRIVEAIAEAEGLSPLGDTPHVPRVAFQEEDFNVPKEEAAAVVIDRINIACLQKSTSLDYTKGAQKEAILQHLSESVRVVNSIADTKKLASLFKVKEIAFPQWFFEGTNAGAYKALSEAFAANGMKPAVTSGDEPGLHSYVMVPLTKEAIAREDFLANLEKIEETIRTGDNPVWLLCFGDETLKEVQRAVATLPPDRSERLSFLLKHQGLLLSEDDLKNADNLAKYLLMKQSLVDIAR